MHAEASGETPISLTAGRPPSHHELRSCRWESDGLREALFNLSPSSLLVALTATADMLWVVEHC